MWLKELFDRAEVRVVSFDGPYDQRPNGDFVHGYVRVTGKLLEIAIGVPSPSFSALSLACAGRNHGELTLTVCPFESEKPWNSKDDMLLREVHFQYELPGRLPDRVHSPVTWLPGG